MSLYMTIYVMIRDVPLGTKHRNWKDRNNEDLCRFHRRHVARLGRRGARDDRRRPGVGPARIRAERRTHGRMAFARRFRSSPPAGEHRVVFLHVARRIALEPGRRTRLRRHARTGRTGRPRLPARPAAAARIQATACTRRKTHPPERRRISALQGFRSEPSRISAGRPRRDRQRSADGGAAHPGESGRIGPLPGARMLTPDRPAAASKAQAADSENTPTSFPNTSERECANCVVGNRFKQSGCRRSIAGANAGLAIGCCFENMRRPDFLDWRACRAAAA